MVAKYILLVLQNTGTITAEEMELARKKFCKKSAIHPNYLAEGIKWLIKFPSFATVHHEKKGKKRNVEEAHSMKEGYLLFAELT